MATTDAVRTNVNTEVKALNAQVAGLTGEEQFTEGSASCARAPSSPTRPSPTSRRSGRRPPTRRRSSPGSTVSPRTRPCSIRSSTLWTSATPRPPTRSRPAWRRPRPRRCGLRRAAASRAAAAPRADPPLTALFPRSGGHSRYQRPSARQSPSPGGRHSRRLAPFASRTIVNRWPDGDVPSSP